MYKVLVTGIGGNVGQGVLMNIRSIDPSIYIVGINVESVTAGNHLCDKVFLVPYAYDTGYIATITNIIEKEEIDLVIPTTDYECLYLAKAKVDKVVASPYETCLKFVNKYTTYISFKEHEIPFANSYLPSEFRNLPKGDYIFKPKEGRGSRGIQINPVDPTKFSDEDYMIQDYVEGREMTTAFYVTKTGVLLGMISMWRSLVNGTTVSCNVTDDFQERIGQIIEKIVATHTIIGPSNMQSRITEEGVIVPFEINGRISGTNSIRSHFGFDDVRYILNEYLFDLPLEKPVIKKGTALRILKDIIYPNIESIDDIEGSNTEHYLP